MATYSPYTIESTTSRVKAHVCVCVCVCVYTVSAYLLLCIGSGDLALVVDNHDSFDHGAAPAHARTSYGQAHARPVSSSRAGLTVTKRLKFVTQSNSQENIPASFDDCRE